jgi:hypothetical protein
VRQHVLRSDLLQEIGARQETGGLLPGPA